MGLAASQARLLFLTARKNDVEFSQMKIANEKIALSRDSEAISEKYNRALNMRKLEWSYDGTPTSSNTVDLTYDLLMTPNDVNKAGQYIITDANGRVALSSYYINKLGLGTSGAAGAIANTYGRDTFVKKFLPDVDMTQYPDGGLGSDGGTKAPTNYKPISTMTTTSVTQINKLVKDFETALATNGYKGSGITAVADIYNNMAGKINSAYTNAKYMMTTMENNSAYYDDPTTIDGKNYLQYKKEYESLTKLKTYTDFLKKLSDLVYSNDKNTQISGWDNLIGADSSPISDNCSDADKAMLDALKCVIAAIIERNNPRDTNEFGAFDIDDNGADTTRAEKMNNGFNALRLDLTVRHDDLGWNGGDGKWKFYAGSVPDLTTMLTTATTGSITQEDAKNRDTMQEKVDYYTNLYYAIKENGWMSNSSLSDKTYLQNQLINGTLQIEKLTTNGFVNMSSADPSSPVRNVKDDEAIAKAESEYTYEKAKLETKENELDLDMKNLDTERSEVDTEYDSVKTIIGKNVERSFKMFA